MITPDIIVKSDRKTLSLCIMKDGQVVLRAPKRAKDSDLDKFVLEKQDWLKGKLSMIENTHQSYQNVISYKSVLFLGQSYKLVLGDKNKVKLDFQDKTISVSRDLDENRVLRALKSWYKKQARKILEQRTTEISNFPLAAQKAASIPAMLI